MKPLMTALIIALGYLTGTGLLVYGRLTGDIWAINIGLPLVLIGAIPIAYQLAKGDSRWGK